jgi:hypothetical protein
MHNSAEVYYSMCDELEKIARGRLERELSAGNLGEAELARLPAYAQQINDPATGRQYLRKLRYSLWGPGGTDLTPEQLARHRRLNRLIGNKDLELLGGSLDPEHTRYGSTRMDTGKVIVHPEGGSNLRYLLEPSERQMPLPQDDTLYRSIVAHEGGEKALMDAAKRHEIPTRDVASHLGGMPAVAEQLAIFRDPEAQKVMYDVARSNQDDAFILRKIRQFGGRYDSPIAIGSRQHAALERALAKYNPRNDMAIEHRAKHVTEGIGHGFTATPGSVAWYASTELPDVQSWARKHVGDIYPTEPDAVQRLARYLYERFDRKVKDPENLADLLKLLPSRVRR